MTSDKKIEDGIDQGATNDAASPKADDAPVGVQASPTATAQAPPAESEEIARLRAEAADLKDRLLRAHAEMDNVRKRLEREKADQAKFAITKFARDVVGIGDNVQRAIEAVPHRFVEQEPALKSFVEGVTMIERELLSVLERHGIQRLDPKGEPFNPHHHQAVVEVPSHEVPAGLVTQVFQSGYMIEERILRPAMVAVSKGGPKPQQPAEAAPEPQASAQHDAEKQQGQGGSSS
jgi:molecular chaperone GrpE